MLYAIVASLVLILDQAVKLWTTKNIVPLAIGDECVELIPGVLHMTNVQNTGAAFSILANARWLLVAVSLVFIIGIIILISSEIISTNFGRWTAVLVMAGALGNCIDRVFYGYVVDMFEIELFNFAVFNVADIFITVCGILFCIHVIFYREPAEVAAAVPKKPRPERPAPFRRPAKAAPARTSAKTSARAAEPEEERPARRTRPARQPKEDPYANIPRRGEHRSLADELKISDPSDPFAEWDFGAEVEAPAAAKKPAAAPEPAPAPKTRASAGAARAQAQAQKKPAPAPEEDDWDDLDFQQQTPAPRKPAARTQAPARPAAQPVPKAPAPEAPAEDTEEYSLEDILAEFRDL